MQSIITRLRQSASLKVAVIGLLILVLLIPIAMIRGVIEERGITGTAARHEIMRTWGEQQLIAGPVIVVPFERTRLTNRGDPIIEKSRIYLLPEELRVEATMLPEIRYRGLHKVPVFNAEILLTGSFTDIAGRITDTEPRNVFWKDAFIAMSVSDARAITEAPSIRVGGETIRFVPGGERIGNIAAPIFAPLGTAVDVEGSSEKTSFHLTLRVNGTDSLRFLPFGDTTSVSVRSSWESPSFVGSYLPERRQIGDDGFSADWRVSSIGRALPSRWTAGDPIDALVDQAAFGVELYMPISLYRLTLRATKYGVLFIGLTFVAYFMFEVVAGLRLHPLQYLLIGLANALFYLLLISLAEHTGFTWAYLISCAASSGLIVGYIYSILGTRLRAAVMAVVLALLYSFLYMTLKAESYALLAGSVGLWLGLAFIMYLTRRIDWYGVKADPVDEQYHQP